MNFRRHFEEWHQCTYGYISPGTGTALNFRYSHTQIQARWEAWQACGAWHTGQEINNATRKVQVSAEYMSKLSEALGHPKGVIAIGSENVDEVLVRMATNALSGCKADAERYRLLPQLDWYVGPEYQTYNDVVCYGEYANHNASKSELDNAIDATMKGQP